MHWPGRRPAPQKGGKCVRDLWDDAQNEKPFNPIPGWQEGSWSLAKWVPASDQHCKSISLLSASGAVACMSHWSREPGSWGGEPPAHQLNSSLFN